jgi:hypothetical protein
MADVPVLARALAPPQSSWQRTKNEFVITQSASTVQARWALAAADTSPTARVADAERAFLAARAGRFVVHLALARGAH